MSLVAEIFIAFLLVVGGVFGVVGGWGLVRLPDPMTRLHAPTKAATLGVGAVLIASMATMWFRYGIVSWHEFMIALFLFLTAPITGYMIAKANMHLGWRPEDLPPPAPGKVWATHAEEDEPRA